MQIPIQIEKKKLNIMNREFVSRLLKIAMSLAVFGSFFFLAYEAQATYTQPNSTGHHYASGAPCAIRILKPYSNNCVTPGCSSEPPVEFHLWDGSKNLASCTAPYSGGFGLGFNGFSCYMSLDSIDAAGTYYIRRDNKISAETQFTVISGGLCLWSFPVLPDTTPPTCGALFYDLSSGFNCSVSVTTECNDSGNNPSGCTQTTFTKTVLVNGPGTIQIADNAGNTTDCPYSVSNILGPPGEVTGVSAENVTEDSVTFIWSNEPNSVSYMYELNNSGNWISNGNSRSKTLTGLQCGVNYTLSVVGVDPCGSIGTCSHPFGSPVLSCTDSITITSCAAMPDYEIADEEIDVIGSGGLCVGDSVLVDVVVRNIGTGDADTTSTTEVLSNGSAVCTQSYTPTLGAGSSYTYNGCGVYFGSVGAYTITADSDIYDKISELNESNNEGDGGTYNVTDVPNASSWLNLVSTSESYQVWAWNAPSGGADDYKVYFDTGLNTVASTSFTGSSLGANTNHTIDVYSSNTCGPESNGISDAGYTRIQSASGANFSNETATSFKVSPQGPISNISSGSSGVRYLVNTSASCSGSDVTSWFGNLNAQTISGLSGDTQYWVCIETRNGDGVSNGWAGPYGTVSTLDSTLPSIVFNPTSRSWDNTNASVKVTASDSRPIIRTDYCWTTGGSCNPSTSFTNGSNISQSSNGTWTLYIEAEDDSNNVGSTNSGTYRVDKQDPVVDSLTVDGKTNATEDPIQNSDGSPNVVWTSSDALSGVDEVEVWRADDNGGSPVNWGQVNTGVEDGSFSDNPGDGTFWYGVHVIDNAGNCALEDGSDCSSGDGDPVRVLVDQDDPVVTINGAPGSWQSSNSLMTVDCSDSGSGCNNSADGYVLYDTNPGSCPVSSGSYSSYSGAITISDHKWVCAYGEDYASRFDTDGADEFRIDKINPTCGSVSYNPPLNTWTNGQVTVTVTCQDTGGSGCSQAQFTANTSSNGPGNITITDEAGNSNTCAYNITNVDTSAPTVSGADTHCDTYNDGCTIDDDTTIFFTWSSSDTGGSGISECWAGANDSPPNEVAGTNGQDTDTGLEGNNIYSVQCQDEAGNLSNIDTDTMVIDMQDPVVSNAQARPDSYSDTGEYDDDTNIFFTWAASDEGSGLNNCWAEIGDSTPDESAGIDGQDTDTGVVGLNTYYVQCEDNVGRRSVIDSDTITVDLQYPAINLFTIDGVNSANDPVQNMNGTPFASWDTSDNEGIERVELWRAVYEDNGGADCDESDKFGCDWQLIDTGDAIDTYSDNPGDGIFWYGLHVIDLAGNCVFENGSNCVSGSGDPIQTRVDSGPPTVTVTGVPVNWTRLTVPIALDCVDVGSGCNNVRDTLRFYTADPGSCPLSYNNTYAYSQPVNITFHQWVCGYGEDTLGNAQNDGPEEIKVDQISPTVDSFTVDGVTSANNPVLSTDGTVLVDWTSSDTGDSGIDGVEVWRRTGSAGTWSAVYSGPEDGNWVDGSPDVLPDGQYFYGIHAIDNAGNCTLEDGSDCSSGGGDPIEVLVDTGSPDITVSTIPDALGNWINIDTSVSVNCSDSGSGCNSGRDTLRIYTTDPGSCPSTYQAGYGYASPLVSTEHGWACGYGEDIIGNIDTDGPQEIRIDKIDPVVTNVTINGGSGSSATGDIDIDWSVIDTGDSGLLEVAVWRYGGSCDEAQANNWSPSDLQNITISSVAPGPNSHSDSITQTGLPDGFYCYGLHVIDWADNEATEEDNGLTVGQVVVDASAPVLSVAPVNSNGWQTNLTSVDIQAQDLGSYVSDARYAYDTSNVRPANYAETNGISFGSGTQTVTTTQSQPACNADYYLYLWATDVNSLGNTMLAGPYECDSGYPVIDTFTIEGQSYPTTVSITSGDPDIIWATTDTTSGISRVEIWRGEDTTSNGNPDTWSLLTSNSPEDGSYIDNNPSPSNGTYWYGLHVLDNAGNCLTEDGTSCGGSQVVGTSVGTTVGPIKVNLDRTVASFTWCSIDSQTVSFVDQSSAGGGFNLADWSWDFGDGSCSGASECDDQNPQHVYVGSGPFSVDVTVTDTNVPVGSSTSVAQTITLGQNNCGAPSPPSNPSPPDSGSGISTSPTLTWTGGHTIPGTPTDYHIYFGDCGNLTYQDTVSEEDYRLTNPLNAGTSYCWQIIADDGTYQTPGAEWTFETVLGIGVVPDADFTYCRPDTEPNSIKFFDTSSDSDGSIISHFWDFGDGVNSSLQHPKHDFDSGATSLVPTSSKLVDSYFKSVWRGITDVFDTVYSRVVSFFTRPEQALAQASWWDSSWGKRSKIVFDNSGQGENLNNFPALITIDSSRIDYASTKSGGADLRFIDSNNSTVLDYEIEEWVNGGTSYIWVKIPRIDAGSNTDHIWMYYDNSSASDAQNTPGVWSEDYMAVWHLNNDFADSTGQRPDATNNGSESVPGVSGSGQNFTKVSFSNGDYIDTNWSPVFSGDTTYEGWFRALGQTNSGTLMGVEDRGSGDRSEMRLSIRDGDTDLDGKNGEAQSYNLELRPDSGGIISDEDFVATNVDDGNWHHWILQRDGTTGRFYYDGTLVPLNDTSVGSGTMSFPVTLLIGAQWDTDTGPGDIRNTFSGDLDELRVSSVARSSDWISATFLSVSDNLVDPGLSWIEEVNGPTAPVLGNFTNLTQESMTVNWTDNAVDEDGYRVYRNSVDTKPGTSLADLSAGSTTFADSGLTCSTTYYYWVEAYNTQGTGEGTASQVTASCNNIEFYDPFIEYGNNVELYAHNPQTGGGTGTGWTEIVTVGSSSNLKVNASGDYLYEDCGQDEGVLYQTNNIMSGPDYEVSVVQKRGDTGYDYNVIATRIQDSNNMYALKWNEENKDSNPGIYRRLNGTWERLRSIYNQPIVNDSKVTLKVEGSTLSILVDDVQFGQSVEDLSHTTAGRAGVGVGAVISSTDDCSSQRLDSFDVRVTGSPPAAPTMGVFTGISKTGVTVNWVDNAVNEDGYRVYRNTTNDVSGATLVASRGSGTESYSDPTLSCGTMYYYWVEAYNSSGTSNASDVLGIVDTISCSSGPYDVTLTVVDNNTNSAIKTIPMIDLGTAPSCSFTLSGNTQCSSVALSWDHTIGASQYEVIRGAVILATFDEGTSGANYDCTSVSGCIYDDNTVTEDQSYLYTVRAIRLDNSTIDAQTTMVTPTCTAGGVDITGIVSACGEISLQWSPSLPGPYRVCRSLQNSSGFVEVANGLVDVAYTDEDILIGTTYYYGIHVENDCSTIPDDVIDAVSQCFQTPIFIER